MDNKIILITILVLIVLILGLFFLFINQPTKRWGRVCFKEHCFDVELARGGVEKTKGLMFRKSLERDKGMLFLFDKEARYSFWMQNTFISLDIIWLNKDKKVVFISENNQPCQWYSCSSINPTADASYVLEINSGMVKEMGLKVGDKLDLTL